MLYANMQAFIFIKLVRLVGQVISKVKDLHDHKTRLKMPIKLYPAQPCTCAYDVMLVFQADLMP